MADTEVVTIKAQLGNHYRRLSVKLHNGNNNEGGYPGLVASVRKIFGIGKGFAVRIAYVDDEGN